jgi:hypothetical protein
MVEPNNGSIYQTQYYHPPCCITSRGVVLAVRAAENRAAWTMMIWMEQLVAGFKY